MSTRKTSQPTRHSAPVQEAAEQDQLGLERLIFFSDAVFAIAITLLVLEIRLPGSAAPLTDAELLASLLGIWQKYLAYVISFQVIGMHWMSHHRKFRFIKHYDSRLMQINLLLLMAVAFIPFPTAVISQSLSSTATTFYALTMVVAGLLSLLLWWYASRSNYVVVHRLAPRDQRREFVAPLTTVAVFLLSIGIAFIDPDLARLSWLLLLIVPIFTKK